MPTIIQLSPVDIANPSDQIPIYRINNGDARRISITSLLTFFQQTFASPDVFTQFVTPGTGFNVAVTNNGNNGWLLLQPAGTLATGTITLPLNTVAADGQELTVTTTQQITALTIGLNGATAVFGAPLSLGADDFFKLRFYQTTNSWYRIG